jgi:hypothetical protein
MLLQLQDFGTSLWQLGRYAIMLPGLFGRSAMVAPGAWHPTIFFCSAGGRKWPFTSVLVATNRQRSDGKPTCSGQASRVEDVKGFG